MGIWYGHCVTTGHVVRNNAQPDPCVPVDINGEHNVKANTVVVGQYAFKSIEQAAKYHKVAPQVLKTCLKNHWLYNGKEVYYALDKPAEFYNPPVGADVRRIKPISVNGVVYKSSSDAERKLGISAYKLRHAAETGKPLDGYEIHFAGFHDKSASTGGRRGKSVMVGDIEYKSINAAARALGTHPHVLRKALRGGQVDFRGTAISYAVEDTL